MEKTIKWVVGGELSGYDVIQIVRRRCSIQAGSYLERSNRRRRACIGGQTATCHTLDFFDILGVELPREGGFLRAITTGQRLELRLFLLKLGEIEHFAKIQIELDRHRGQHFASACLCHDTLVGRVDGWT